MPYHAKTIVVGCGNILFKDDGYGPIVVNLLEKYFESKQAFVELGFQDTFGEIKNIKIVNTADIVSPPVRPFRCDEGITYSGDEKNGYTLVSTEKNKFASYKTPIDFNKQAINFQMTLEPNTGWMHIGFLNTFSKVGSSAFPHSVGFVPEKGTNNKLEEKYWAISLIVTNINDNAATFDLYYDGEKHLLGKVSGFDWNKSHTYGFAKDKNGNWTIVIDGASLREMSTTYKESMKHIAPLLEKYFESKEYTSFTLPS